MVIYRKILSSVRRRLLQKEVDFIVKSEMNCMSLRSLVEKKREEMIPLTKSYRLTSPELIRVSKELDKLKVVLFKRKCMMRMSG